VSAATLSAVACRLSFDFDTVVSRAGVPVGSMLLLLRSLVAKSGALVGRLFSVAPGKDGRLQLRRWYLTCSTVWMYD
jgi:hypothetical protein